MVAEKELPTVNVSEIFNPENKEANWNAVAKELGECLHKIGFVYVTGHGISQELITNVFASAKEVLNLPVEVQKKYRKVDPTISFTGFHLDGEESLDEKTYEVKRSYDIQLTSKATPPEVPEYEHLSLDMLKACEDLKDNILRLLATYLGLEDRDFFVKMATYWTKPGEKTNKTGLRALLYPALPEDFKFEDDMMRCAPHTDWGMITFLFQDDVGGLQVKNQDGEWIEVPPMPGSFVMNVGGMLEILSRGYFPATWHRIPMTKESERLSKSRYSMGFFFFPDDDVMIEPLDEARQFVETGKDFSDVPAVTVKEYFNIRAINTKLG